jgi:large subunit ribosomal protein L21
MYAVIVTGGKQYRVEVGTELEVELLDVEPGQAITLDRVLLVADGDESAIGRPLVADAAVSAEVVRQTRGEKIIAFKYRPKARSRVKKGHRQELTVLRITDVRLGSKSAAESVRKAEADAKTERQRLEEAAAKQAAVDAALAAKLAKTAPAEAKPTKSSTAKPKASATKADSKTAAKAAPKSAAKATPKKPAAKASAADDKTTKKTAPKAAPKKAAPKTTRPTKDK